MKTLVVLAALTASPQLARADGFFKCNPDGNGLCNTSGTDSATVGWSLLLLGAVTYGLARSKRRHRKP